MVTVNLKTFHRDTVMSGNEASQLEHRDGGSGAIDSHDQGKLKGTLFSVDLI
jgi:hypothetical protein